MESNTGENETCRYCLAAWGDGFGCERHTPIVHALARIFAEHYQNASPTEEQIGWFVEDAEAIVGGWPNDSALDVQFLGRTADGREHFTVNGQRWAEPDPSAEGFNSPDPMAPCPAEHGDDTCEDCGDTGWVHAADADESLSGGNSSTNREG